MKELGKSQLGKLQISKVALRQMEELEKKKNIEMDLKKIFEHPLEQRCFLFASDVRSLCRNSNQDIVNVPDIRQLVRSSGSVAANYIEANEKLGDGDLKFRIKIARKEAKESI